MSNRDPKTVDRPAPTAAPGLDLDAVDAAERAMTPGPWVTLPNTEGPDDVVPGNVKVLVKETVDGALEAGRCSALGHAYLLTKDPAVTVPRLMTAIARAISDATGKRDAEWQKRIAPLHPNRTGDGCDSGDPIDWTFAALMLARIDVESDAHDEGHRAAMRDATAAPPTVGGLLATAREGDIIEFDEGSWWMQVMAFGGVVRWRVHDADANGWHPYIDDPSSWHCDELVAFWLTKPARLVPPDIADLDPATRGPLPKGGDR